MKWAACLISVRRQPAMLGKALRELSTSRSGLTAHVVELTSVNIASAAMEPAF
jgi:hypothetical protein